MQEETIMLDDISDDHRYLEDLFEAERDLQSYRQILVNGVDDRVELSNNTRTAVAVGVRMAMVRAGSSAPSIALESLGDTLSLESIDESLKKVWVAIKKTAAAAWQKVKDFVKWLGAKISNAFFILIRERALTWEKGNYQIRRGDLNPYFDPDKPIPTDWDKQLVGMVTSFDKWVSDYMARLTDDVERMGSCLRFSLNTPSEPIADKRVIDIVRRAKSNISTLRQQAKLGRYHLVVDEVDFDEEDPESIYNAYAQMVPKLHRPRYHDASFKNAHAVLIRGDDMRKMTESLAKEVEGVIAELNDTVKQLDNNISRIDAMSPRYNEETAEHNREVMGCVRRLVFFMSDVTSTLSNIPMNVIKDITGIIEGAKSLDKDGGTMSK